MVDPKATNKKAQDILKSMQINYDDSGNITITYFETLEKTLFDWARKRKSTTNKPEVADHPVEAAPAPPEPPKPSQEAGMPPVEPPKKPEQGQTPPTPQVVQMAPVDSIHQAKAAVAPPSQIAVAPRENAISTVKGYIQSGLIGEKKNEETGETERVLEVSPEQAKLTLEPTIEFFNAHPDSNFMELIEVMRAAVEDKVAPADFNPRIIQVVKHEIAKQTKATPENREFLLKRFDTLVPFNPEEKKADPYINKMYEEFKETFNLSGIDEKLKDKVNVSTLGVLLGSKYLKHLKDEYTWLDRRQLEKIAEAPIGKPISRQQETGKFVKTPATEEDIKTAQHELRIRDIINDVQHFLWDNYGITTYLGNSWFGSSKPAMKKRIDYTPKLNSSIQQLIEELESANTKGTGMIGKSGPIRVDMTDWPEEKSDKYYFIIKRNLPADEEDEDDLAIEVEDEVDYPDDESITIFRGKKIGPRRSDY